MKYKVGDKVKIRTWKDLVSNYGEFYDKQIRVPNFTIDRIAFNFRMEQDLKNLNSYRILTIKKVYNTYYRIEEIGWWAWADYMIKCRVKEGEIYIPITSRFEILDL